WACCPPPPPRRGPGRDPQGSGGWRGGPAGGPGGRPRRAIRPGQRRGGCPGDRVGGGRCRPSSRSPGRRADRGRPRESAPSPPPGVRVRPRRFPPSRDAYSRGPTGASKVPRHSIPNPKLAVGIAVADEHAVATLREPAAQLLDEHDRAVSAARAAERDGEIALPLALVERQGEGEEVEHAVEELLALLAAQHPVR